MVRAMKRIAATALWFYAGWFAGAFAAFVLGASPVLGPIVGTALGAFVGVDPQRLFWARPATSNVAPFVGPAPVQSPA